MSRYWPAGVALAAGLLLGYLTGATLSRGGFAAFGAFAYILIAGAIVAGLGAIALGAALTNRGSLARVSFVTGVVLAATTAISAGALVKLNPASRPPVILYATGTVSPTVSADGFEPADSAAARCVSQADSTATREVRFEDLGALNGAALRGFVTIPEFGVDGAAAFLFVHFAGSAGEVTLRWSGVATLEVTGDRISGTASFTRLPLEQLTPEPAQTEGWPSAISGQLEWRCDPWLPAGSYLD